MGVSSTHAISLTSSFTDTIFASDFRVRNGTHPSNKEANEACKGDVLLDEYRPCVQSERASTSVQSDDILTQKLKTTADNIQGTEFASLASRQRHVLSSHDIRKRELACSDERKRRVRMLPLVALPLLSLVVAEQVEFEDCVNSAYSYANMLLRNYSSLG